MKTLATNTNNDLFLTNSSLVIESNLNALALHCSQVVKILKGELILDLSRGVLGFENNYIFGNTPDAQLFEFKVREELLKVDGVLDVEFLNFNAVGEVFSYTATIKTIYGTLDFNSELFL